jgi:hypothetical protein
MRKDTKNTIGWDNPMPGELKNKWLQTGIGGHERTVCDVALTEYRSPLKVKEKKMPLLHH